MREKLLEWLVCPSCRDELKLVLYEGQGDEINEGALHCQCGLDFPIIEGVPRLLCDKINHELPKLYPEFYKRHFGLLAKKKIYRETLLCEKKKATVDRFGYEWVHFSDYDCDNFKSFIAPLSPGFFKGKLGLDIGCGAGRHALQASQSGAEIVAIDLSQAVDSAQHNNNANNQIHIIQADIYNLPFKSEIFDFIYSLGVLHHLPDPENGYQALIPFLREDGALFVWLYAFSFRKIVLEILRAVSQRLSNKNIQRMAFLCNLIDYGIFINLFRLAQHVPVLEKWAKQYTSLRIIEYATHGFRVSYTDWFDRLSAPITNYYKENEMKLWLQHSDLRNTRLLSEGDSWWWLYGERKAKL